MLEACQDCRAPRRVRGRLGGIMRRVGDSKAMSLNDLVSSTGVAARLQRAIQGPPNSENCSTRLSSLIPARGHIFRLFAGHAESPEGKITVPARGNGLP